MFIEGRQEFKRESDERNLKENRVAELNKEMGQYLEKHGVKRVLMADIMTCFCAGGNNPVETEKLIMQKTIGERIVIWKPPKELLRHFRLFTPGVPYPPGMFIMLLRFSLVRLLHQIPLVVSVPPSALVFPLLFSVIPPLRAQKYQGIFHFLNMEP